MKNYEKLGAFYLGRGYDLERRETTDDLLLYDSRDLTTHAVCVGMTGSGKTGLCVSLIEEAAIDGVPALVIDPKGDLGNLLLTFPELRAEDFRPWVDEDEAGRKELSIDEYARQQAEAWREGLASWGQSGERIRRLREAADFGIYTPGSDAGWPVSILSSFAAPPEAVVNDGDLFRERVATTATSLLGLMDIDADPITSREHILLSTLLERAWREGRDVDLAGLIQAIQSPPVERVGVMELDSFYPAKERFALAMQLNSLLAAPGFGAWLEGQPLDIQRLLYTPEGKPRIAVFHIAHLPDSQRMFFVSLLLNQLLGWIRTRPGTGSLRALLYMDEIAGFMPPVAEPPSKKPLLTLLKQARAYGLGLVLATQNPGDLDYKGLSNAGTWLLGRLQTERDKQRVLEGLEGAAGGSLDRQKLERTLAGLGKRVFMMHNVHEDGPVVFHTRWAMSYLGGPLTRQQVKRLMGGRPVPVETAAPPAAAPPPVATPAAAASTPAVAAASARPVLPPGVPQAFLAPRSASAPQIVYKPALVGLGRVRFLDKKTKKVKHTDEIALSIPLHRELIAVDWHEAEPADICLEDLERSPLPSASFDPCPAAAEKATSYRSWKRQFADHLYRNSSLTLYKSATLGLTAEPGESEGDFRARLAEIAREQRDREAEKLRKKYRRRLTSLEDRIRRAAEKVELQKEQASGQKLQTAISLGATVLTALLGRKAFSRGTLGRATTTARGAGRIARERQDIGRAHRDMESLQEQLEELNAELESELELLEDRLDAQTEELEEIALRPRRADVDVRRLVLTWAPHAQGPDGGLAPLWK